MMKENMQDFSIFPPKTKKQSLTFKLEQVSHA